MQILLHLFCVFLQILSCIRIHFKSRLRFSIPDWILRKKTPLSFARLALCEVWLGIVSSPLGHPLSRLHPLSVSTFGISRAVRIFLYPPLWSVSISVLFRLLRFTRLPLSLDAMASSHHPFFSQSLPFLPTTHRSIHTQMRTFVRGPVEKFGYYTGIDNLPGLLRWFFVVILSHSFPLITNRELVKLNISGIQPYYMKSWVL